MFQKKIVLRKEAFTCVCGSGNLYKRSEDRPGRKIGQRLMRRLRRKRGRDVSGPIDLLFAERAGEKAMRDLTKLAGISGAFDGGHLFGRVGPFGAGKETARDQAVDNGP